MLKKMILAAVLFTTATGAVGQTQDRSRREEIREWLRTGQAPASMCMADDVPVSERLEAGTLGAGCFEMWTGCSSMSTSVTVSENTIGLRKNNVENAVESRLRAASVYTDDWNGNSLDVRVAVLESSNVFNIGLRFYKRGVLRDEYGFTAYTPAWQAVFYGTGSASFVMESLRSLLDEFMNHYLRVNERACFRR